MSSADVHGRQPQRGEAEAAAMYTRAIGFQKARRYDEALTWYRKAADAGHADAMHNLAIQLRYRGKVAEAAIWWSRAGHEQPQRMTEKMRGLQRSHTRGRRSHSH